MARIFDVNIIVDSANNTTTFTLYAIAGSIFDLVDDGDIQGSVRVTVCDVPVVSDLVTVSITSEDNSYIADDTQETFNGRSGTDTLSYENSDEAVTVELIDNTKDANGFITASGGDAEGDRIKNIENLNGSAYDDRIIGDGENNIIEGGAGVDYLHGGAGDDVFVAHVADGDTDTIIDFTSGDKIRVDVADPSSINNLASLFGTLSISEATTSSGVTLTFDRGANGSDASYYMLVLDGFTGTLAFTDFEVI